MGPHPSAGTPLVFVLINTISAFGKLDDVVPRPFRGSRANTALDFCPELVAVTVHGKGLSTPTKVQFTNTFPWFVAGVRVQVIGPTESISLRRKYTGPYPRTVSPSP